MFPFTLRTTPKLARHLQRSEPDCSRGTDELWRRIAETVAWCQAHIHDGSPDVSLRPESFRPRILEPDYFAAVRSVAISRAHQVASSSSDRTLADGRLLLYFPDAELADGAAEVESNGFFDVNNAPPHATWVGIFRDRTSPDHSYATYLVAWVPPSLIQLVDQGIAVNPEECIAWLSSSDVALRSLWPEL